MQFSGICDILNVKYLSKFVKGSERRKRLRTLRKRQYFAILSCITHRDYYDAHIIGGLLGKALMKKHFEKAGIA